MQAERYRPFVERIDAGGVVYEHSADGSPATATLAELHPGKVISFSPHHTNSAYEAFREHGRDRITLISSVRKTPVYEADLIVLSGFNSGGELQSHLFEANAKSRRFIAIELANQSDSVEVPDLLATLRVFLHEFSEWSVVSQNQEGDGLTILSRDEGAKPVLSSKITMASNFAQAIAKHVADGVTKVDQTILQHRLGICTICEHRNDGRRSVCGCYLSEKVAWRTSEYPMGKWER